MSAHLTENDAIRQIVLAYAAPVTSPGRDSLEQTVDLLAEYVADRVSAAVASIEEYEGKVPGYFTESLNETDIRSRIVDLLPDECWVSRSDDPATRCTRFVGGTFLDGAAWTEDMCCLPCRIRDAVSPLEAGEPA